MMTSHSKCVFLLPCFSVMLLIVILSLACVTKPTASQTCIQYLEKDDFLSNLRDEGEIQYDDVTGRRASMLGSSANTNCTLHDDCAFCAGKNLQSVPQNLWPNITFLDLRFNKIRQLEDNAFARYPQLIYLNVSNNQIDTLTNLSFSNLSHLFVLDLRGNLLELNSTTFPTCVFCPLQSLSILHLQRNSDLKGTNLHYPDEALSHLSNLTRLSIDGLRVRTPTPFGRGFRNLTRLTELSVAGFEDGQCKMHALYNDTFQNLETVEYLHLHDCAIKGTDISPGAFLPLKRLRLLDLSYNEDIYIAHLDNVFYGLQHAENLTTLHMQMVVNRYSRGICLDVSYIKYFPQTLTYFDFRENNMEAVDRNVIRKLAPTLKVLNLSGNRFVFGAYLLDLPLLTNLQTLFLDGFSFQWTIPSYYPFEDNDTLVESGQTCSIYLKGPRQHFQLLLPPNLTSIYMNNAGLHYNITKLNVSENNSLKSLIMSENRFPFLNGPIIGLHSLEELDVSVSFVSRMHKTFFEGLSSLKRLNLGSNLLGYYFTGSIENYHVFSGLRNLEMLNLSFNDLHFLPLDVFEPLVNLKYLYLMKNPLMEFKPSITCLSHLLTLDLSITHIPTLPQDTRDHIRQLINVYNLTVRVNMTQNPIMCDCSNLDFIQWMTNSGAFDKNFTNYRCEFDEFSVNITDGYQETLAHLAKECAHNILMFFLVGSGTLATFIFIIGAIIFRFRWNIRYMYYAAYLRYKKKSKRKEDAFEFDVFICYAEEDKEFAEDIMDKELRDRGLSVFLHRRDFQAGQFISSNIVQAVCSCRKTVVVLTQALMDSHWCLYEIEMAKMEGLYTGRQVLVFILKEIIPKDKLGRDLLYNIKNNTYQEFPDSTQDQDQMRTWWDKLASDIQTD